jgi:peptidoglycan/xylan/chitin deacetylase (PgdA/CDA1 family)
MVIEVAAGALTAAAAALAYGVRAPRSSLITPSEWKGTSSRGSIALTFDDGPSEATPQVLDVLNRFGVKATFFECGTNARRLPEVTRQVKDEGHEIGNHTDTHPFLHLRGAAFIRNEILAAQRAIEKAAGVKPTVFRAPYGVRWFGLAGVQNELGLTGVTWSVLGLDWKQTPGQVARRLLKLSRPGAIVCLHDGRELRPNPDISVTLEALRLILPQWLERGVQFETVSQILCPTN